MTPEERLAEQLRLQQIQDDPDAAVDTPTSDIDQMRIDQMQATNKAELSGLADAIGKKVNQFRHLEDYPTFLEDMMCSICSSRKWN